VKNPSKPTPPGRKRALPAPAAPAPRRTKSHFLLQTRVDGERMREETLQAFAEESHQKAWSEDRCHLEALNVALDAALAGKFASRRSINTLIGELRLAGHVDVRGEYSRLKAIRDQVWAADPAFLRETMHGPYQTLTHVLHRQRNADERQHVINKRAYMTYLQKSLRRKQAATE
jgi:hypothetical protein